MMEQRLSPRENGTTFSLSAGLPRDAVRFFDENGFVVFRRVFSGGELNQMLDYAQAVIDDLPADHSDLTLSESEDGKRHAGRVYHLSRHSERLHDFIHSDPRFKLIAQLCPGGRYLDEDRKSAVVYQEKRPEVGSGFRGLRWHDDRQDVLGRLLTVGIYFDASTQGNGALRVVPGTHKLDASVALPPEVDLHPNEVAVVAEPGDVTAHLSGLWHCSPAGWVGGEAGCRRVIYVTYCENLPKEAPKELSTVYRKSVDL